MQTTERKMTIDEFMSGLRALDSLMEFFLHGGFDVRLPAQMIARIEAAENDLAPLQAERVAIEKDLESLRATKAALEEKTRPIKKAHDLEMTRLKDERTDEEGKLASIRNQRKSEEAALNKIRDEHAAFVGKLKAVHEIEDQKRELEEKSRKLVGT